MASSTGSNPLGIIGTDITGEQAGGEGLGPIGVCQGAVEGIRVPNGDRHLCASRGAGMVPIRLGVPNKVVVQPGILPRPPNLSHLGWREETKLR